MLLYVHTCSFGCFRRDSAFLCALPFNHKDKVAFGARIARNRLFQKSCVFVVDVVDNDVPETGAGALYHRCDILTNGVHYFVTHTAAVLIC